ncbi:hypothetical protein FDENT_12900 [Fusarium denticulatum]|uniref:Uncharacterized protein n=1 Tax=Fusarium denticulatum TaxID=48507 RepID=A0A8H5T4A3_9HYPO|nr:hypothetical protein FDENT_12900 [Fusarium denticulatum]
MLLSIKEFPESLGGIGPGATQSNALKVFLPITVSEGGVHLRDGPEVLSFENVYHEPRRQRARTNLSVNKQVKYKLLKTEVHKLQDGSSGNDKEVILEKLLTLKVVDVQRLSKMPDFRMILGHLEMMLCAQFEDPYQAVYSPAFRYNSTKYRGVPSKVYDKDKLPHEPGFWLDDINNAATDGAPSDIENSETSRTDVDEDGDDDSGAFGALLKDSKSLNTPYLAIMNAQAEAYLPDILYLYSHLVPQDLINDDQDVDAGSEESGDDAESLSITGALTSARWTWTWTRTSRSSISMGKAHNEAILEKLLSLEVADEPDVAFPKEGETEYCPCVGNRTMEAAQQHIIAWATSALAAVHAYQRISDEFEEGIDAS